MAAEDANGAATGVLAHEAMALGHRCSPTTTRSLSPLFQADVPIVRVSPKTLADELEGLLDDPDRMDDLTERGRDYLRHTHAPTLVTAAALDAYRHARDGEPGLYETTTAGLRAMDTLEERLLWAGATVPARPPASAEESG